MHQNKGPVYYGEYLKLKELLSCQQPLSRKYASEAAPEAHDETLFIVVHQAYEIWFKQILHDINSIISIFKNSTVEESEFGTILPRLTRITKIQTMLLSYMDILETMTPMEFLEFRNLLIPASGFQSVQFREIEIKMGLKTYDRENIDREYFLGRLNDEDRNTLVNLEKEETLTDLLQKWLERMPFTKSETSSFDFWKEYKNTIHKMMDQDQKTIESNVAHLTDESKKMQLDNLQLTRDNFESLLDEKKHNQLITEGKRKLSHKATLNALFILLYRDEPLIINPHRMLSLLMDIDENFTAWRYRHALMAQRMLGAKIGTGGSSGHQYLKRAAENNRAFLDLFNLSTFIIPKSARPDLPVELKKQLSFHFNHV